MDQEFVYTFFFKYVIARYYYYYYYYYSKLLYGVFLYADGEEEKV